MQDDIDDEDDDKRGGLRERCERHLALMHKHHPNGDPYATRKPARLLARPTTTASSST